MACGSWGTAQHIGSQTINSVTGVWPVNQKVFNCRLIRGKRRLSANAAGTSRDARRGEWTGRFRTLKRRLTWCFNWWAEVRTRGQRITTSQVVTTTASAGNCLCCSVFDCLYGPSEPGNSGQINIILDDQRSRHHSPSL